MDDVAHSFTRRVKVLADRITKRWKERYDPCIDLHIYLMCIPPENLEDMDVWKSSGITEVAFNIEVFSDKIARKVMPGKARIPRSKYISALIKATQVWDSKGSVRSVLIAGLEPTESTLECVKLLASIGVAPVISIIRPVSGTDMERVMPLSSLELYRLYHRASKYCSDVGLELGPSCIECQNNTLTMPRGL